MVCRLECARSSHRPPTPQRSDNFDQFWIGQSHCTGELWPVWTPPQKKKHSCRQHLTSIFHHHLHICSIGPNPIFPASTPVSCNNSNDIQGTLWNVVRLRSISVAATGSKPAYRKWKSLNFLTVRWLFLLTVLTSCGSSGTWRLEILIFWVNRQNQQMPRWYQ